MRLWLRLLVAMTATAFVWLLVDPAWAAAPQCDPRAASTIAPNPLYEAPTASLDAAPLACANDYEFSVNCEQGHTIYFDFSIAHTILPASVTVPKRDFVVVPIPQTRDACSSDHIRNRVERPPR